VNFFIGTSVSAPVQIHAGALYAGEGTHETHGARVYKFDLASGQLVATFTSEGHIEGELVAKREAGQDFRTVPTGAGGLVALDASTLQIKWQAKDGHIDAGANIDRGIVFAAAGIEKEISSAAKGQAFAYRLTDGKLLWRRELPASSWMRPLAVENLICFVFGEIYFPSTLGGLQCFDQRTGSPGISFTQGAPVVANPILVDGDMVISDIHGKICRISLLNGKNKWCLETCPAEAAMSDAIMDERLGVIVYASESQGLFVIDPDKGAVLQQWKAHGQAKAWLKTMAPIAVLRDSWVIVDMKGIVRKLRWRILESPPTE
jgi:outer membrane protein assembly factor BamB